MQMSITQTDPTGIKYTLCKVKPVPGTDKFLGAMMIVTGLLLLAIVWFIGIPFLFMGAALIFQGEKLEGFCPYCEHRIEVESAKTGINCPTCDKRVIVDSVQKRFWQITE